MASLADLGQTALTPTWTHLVTRGERSLPIFPYAHNYAHVPAGAAGRMPSQPFTQPRMTPLGNLRPRRPVAPPPPPPTTSSRFLALFDPPSLFSRPGLTKKSSKVERYPTTTTEAPPLVYFPEGGEGECGDYSSGGFDAYSFVGFLLGVVNIVAQVANNVNNNLNNNNNNNNDNNNNLDNINSATSNANQNNMNTVNIPPGGRRRRHTREERAWRERRRRRLHDEEAVAASVALHFLRAFWLLTPDGSGHCALRIVCEANSLAVQGRETDLALVFAEVFTEALAEWSPAGAVPKSLFTSAGARGRSGHDCSRLSSRCSTAAWEGVKKGMGDDLSLDLSFLKEEGQRDLLGHIMTHAEDFAKMGLPDISSIMDLGYVVP